MHFRLAKTHFAQVCRIWIQVDLKQYMNYPLINCFAADCLSIHHL